MIPRQWNDLSSELPYSVEAPLVERLLRHTGMRYGKIMIVMWLIGFAVALGTVLMLPSLPQIITDGLLLVGWGISIMMILGAAFLGATMSGTQVRSPSYQLLWMTRLSDHALASSLLVATLHRLRLGIALVIGIAPIVIYGMVVGQDWWALETLGCPTTWELGWCQEQQDAVQSIPLSIILGVSLWLSMMALLPVGAMLGVWLGVRWRQTSIAALVAVGMMGILALIIGMLGIWMVGLSAPIREALVWGVELGLFSAMMVVVLTAVIFWRDGLMQDEGIETFLYVLSALTIIGWGLGFYAAHPTTRDAMVNVLGVLAIPYGLLLIGVHVFWRGARTQVDG